MKREQRNRDRFARLLIERLRRGGETRPIEYDREDFLLCIGDDTYRLGNLFYYYTSYRGRRRDEYLCTQVRAWFVTQKGLPPCLTDVKADLLPKLESRAELDAEKLDRDWKAACPYQLIGEHLGLTLVYDLPDAFARLSESHLKKWGVSLDEAMTVARQNLLTLPMPVFVSPHPGVHVSRTGDNYDATRLILTEVVGELPVSGATIAMPVQRDTLIITGTEDEAGLAAMAEIAVEEHKKPYGIALLAFRLEQGEWLPWLPAPEHPQHQAFRNLELQYISEAYSRQKRLLEQICVKEEGEFCFPAAFAVCQHKDTDKRHSVTMLIEAAMPNSCPVAEEICITRATGPTIADEDVCLVDWSHAVEILGDAMRPLDIYPPRYLVTEFPNGAKWERLRQVAYKPPAP